MSGIHTPDWVKDAVFYQIFPDRFAFSDKVSKPKNLETWDSPPTIHGYKGGDLWGVIEHLDYLQTLGITAIYFTPIFQSASNHRYHTHDYYQIDPLLGGNEAFYALRDSMHQKGMKLVLDGVFNHASRGNYYFHDILENGPNSAWLDWFVIQDWPVSAYDESKPANYEAWMDLRALPQWNTKHPQVREYLMQIGEHWIREGIDGWRLDVPFCITAPGFWHEFRQRVKTINPEAYIVGEVWWDSRNYLGGDQFDATMNYLFTEAVIQFTGQQHLQYDVFKGIFSHDPYPAIDAQQYATTIERLLGMYDWEITRSQLNLLSSHDTPRLLTMAGGNQETVKLAMLLLMTYPGVPCIYYGDEIGLAGGRDPDCRRTIPWNKPANWNQEILKHAQALISLRHEHPAMRKGKYQSVYSVQDTYIFTRQWEHDHLLIALNVGDSPQTVTIPSDWLGENRNTQVKTIFGSCSAKVDSSLITLKIPAREGIVLAL